MTLEHFISILTILILHQSWVVIAIYNRSSTPLTNDRTAILLTGQLRSGNTKWTDSNMKRDFGSSMFGKDDPPTPISTVIRYLFEPLAEHGYIDLFVFIQLGHDKQSQDSNKLTLCELYGQYDVFHPSTGNKIFCLAEEETELCTPLIDSFPYWESYMDTVHSRLSKERLLQQLYGLYRANLAATQYALSKQIEYSYKIRLRPDIAIVKPLPRIDEIIESFKKSGPQCEGTIYYPNFKFYWFGGEDSFNMGEAKAMDKLLNRYLDLISSPFIYQRYRSLEIWNSESYLIGLMQQKYHICFESALQVWFVLIRLYNHATPTVRSVPVNNDTWIELGN